MRGDHLDVGYLVALWGVVAFGAVVPVVPTGAAVSAAAVLGVRQSWWEVIPVVVVGALGAYCGDVTTYAVLRRAGLGVARRLRWLRAEDSQARLERVRRRVEEHEISTLLVSRLIPGGRIPVLVGAALTGYPWRRFAFTALFAATLWAACYSVVGLLGGLLPDPRVGIAVAVVAALAFTATLRLVTRRHALTATADGRRPA